MKRMVCLLLLTAVPCLDLPGQTTNDVRSTAEAPGRGPGWGRRGGGPGGGMRFPEWEPLPVTEEQAREQVVDVRQHVPMPAESRKILREQMREFLAVLAQIQGLLIEEKLDEAAELAESKMGRSERGRHRGFGPGRYMPVPMRRLAWGMHDAASAFAETAQAGDLKSSYRALQNLQTSCLACHFTYTTK